MVIKYFDEFNGQYIDLTGTTGQGLEYGASGWVTTSKNSYRSFVGEISQTGSDDPTITTLFNNTGATFTITKLSTGVYRFQSDFDLFVQGQMWWYIGNNQNAFGNYNYQIKYVSITEMEIQSLDNGSVSDDILQNTSFEFRQY
jgi:hypothetical protein